jgi:hypothetical protein
MDPQKAELLAGMAGAGAFLTPLIVAGWPLWLCLTITVLIYLGVNLVLGGLFQNKVQQLMGGTAASLTQLSAQIDENRRQLGALRQWIPSVPHTNIRDRVSAVCDLAEKIFDNFAEDPEDIRRAHRFLSQFQKVLPIVQDYVHLASDRDRRQVLTDADEKNIELTLDAFEHNLRNAYQGFQENNLQKLRMATGTLKRMLEMDRAIHPSDREKS